MSAEPSRESSARLSDPAENGQVSASENVRVLYRLRNRNITASSPSAVLSRELIADSYLSQGGASGPRSSASAAAMESGSPSPDSGPQGPQHFALSSAAGSASSVSIA
uniref:Uncharacterized protein n=1 Tax=Chromera velia CCMP2878 TaxID=1169474 RepID=A0A0G4H7A5_9ALVE|eukprot:Cvel_25004.t1-p1 / transcript=Cvel_25004.t1 / gene=Cvel_25004 / organism=Chromera_velia_CCMP2878 / gene_product=hypothetical protein / transcript_product=hypothetical protein / location=Cvel_scaffold2771:18242-19870(-) / protein_length=107 / sequence_SO=supercontig / SO=protein_coding / is_pseudo=false